MRIIIEVASACITGGPASNASYYQTCLLCVLRVEEALHSSTGSGSAPKFQQWRYEDWISRDMADNKARVIKFIVWLLNKV